MPSSRRVSPEGAPCALAGEPRCRPQGSARWRPHPAYQARRMREKQSRSPRIHSFLPHLSAALTSSPAGGRNRTVRRIRGIYEFAALFLVFRPFCRRAGTSRRPYAEASGLPVGATFRSPAPSLPRARGRCPSAHTGADEVSRFPKGAAAPAARSAVILSEPAGRVEGSRPRRKVRFLSCSGLPTWRRRDPSSASPPQDDRDKGEP